MRPFKCNPILKRIRWGGRRLGELLGKSLGEGADYAESWEVCDHGADQSLVAAGEYQDWPLQQLVRNRAAQLLGRHAGIGQFPLLIKFLDAHDRLSVQVHPNDEQARQSQTPKPHTGESLAGAFVQGAHGKGAYGKTEAWVVLAAEKGSCVFAGLRKNVTESALRQAVSLGTVETCLHRVEVSAGDVLFIPAGTVHAIGEGIVLAEVQQSSDITFRLFDWNRVSADGSPRELHVEQALACIDFARGPVEKIAPAVNPATSQLLEVLVECAYFTIHRHTISQSFSIAADDRCHILMGLSGVSEVVTPGNSQQLQTGETLLVPACSLPATVRPRTSSVALEVFWN